MIADHQASNRRIDCISKKQALSKKTTLLTYHKPFYNQEQATTNKKHQPPTQQISQKTTDFKIASIKSVKGLVQHMEQLAKIDYDKQNKKYNRQQRKKPGTTKK